MKKVKHEKYEQFKILVNKEVTIQLDKNKYAPAFHEVTGIITQIGNNSIVIKGEYPMFIEMEHVVQVKQV